MTKATAKGRPEARCAASAVFGRPFVLSRNALSALEAKPSQRWMNRVSTRASAGGREWTLTRSAAQIGPSSARGRRVMPSPAATQPKMASSVPNSRCRRTAIPRCASMVSSAQGHLPLLDQYDLAARYWHRSRLTERLGIRHPILLAPMGFVSGGALAAAVSAAGGLGLIGCGYAEADWLR